MMKKHSVAGLLAVLMVMSLLGGAVAEEMTSFTDSAGRTVEVPVDITRIAPTGGTAQIALLALAPEYLVGIAAKWTPQAEAFLGEYYTLPVLGQLFNQGDLNLETLAAADPQVIIDVGESKKTIAEDLDQLEEQIGIPAVHISATLDTFPEACRQLGALLGLEARAEEIAAYCEKVNARTAQIMEQVGENRIHLVYCLGEDGLNVIAKGAYHGGVIDMLAENLAEVENSTGRGTGDPVDMEQLMLWNPPVIIFSPDGAYDTVGEDPLWQGLVAIASGQYAQVPFGPYNWMGFPPAVQQYLGVLWMTDLLYPGLAQYDLYEEVAEYFRLFYHHDLSREAFDGLMEGASFAG